MQSLLACGVRVNGRNVHLKSALHIATQLGNISCVEVLLGSCFINVNTVDIFGYTPLQYSVSAQNYSISALLIEAGAEKSVTMIECQSDTLLHSVARNGQSKLMRYLLKFGLDLNMTNSYDHTPLHVALIQGHALTALELIRCGALLPNADSHQIYEQAAFKDHVEVIDLMENWRIMTTEHSAMLEKRLGVFYYLDDQ